MKKSIYLLISFFCVYNINAQNINIKTDSLQKNQDTIKKVEIVNNSKLLDTINIIEQLQDSINKLNKKNNYANNINKEQIDSISILKEQVIELCNFEKENGSLKLELDKVNIQNDSLQIELLIIASNFLYIPYEAYSVEKIAIKSFDLVIDSVLKNKNKIFLELLTNYSKHLLEFKNYLLLVQKECKEPYLIDANEFINSDEMKREKFILHKQPFYIEYKKYDDYDNTNMGKLFKKCEFKLKAHTKQKPADFKDIIEDIDRQLKTKEGF